MTEYANPDVLVSTDWVADHLEDPNIRIVESDEDITLYPQGHVPGAVTVDWMSELQDTTIRDYVDREGFERLMRERGIGNDHLVVLYGDDSNWWACYAFWAFRMFGHGKLAIMNGGRDKWVAEGRSLTKDVPDYPATDYVAQEPDYTWRAFSKDVLAHQAAGKPLVDVRSPGEYTGELQHMPDYPQEGSLRTGHIPGAVSCPWSRATNDDGTFKSADELHALYEGELGLSPEDEIVAYCRIGERSSHTWFVLHHLLGFPHVRNYDGSWTEWGNLVGVPIEKSV